MKGAQERIELFTGIIFGEGTNFMGESVIPLISGIGAFKAKYLN
jgi:hypothetical protein